MTQNDERMRILEMIDNGTISAQEGLRLLEVIDRTSQPESERIDPDDPQDNVHPSDADVDMDGNLDVPDSLSANHPAEVGEQTNPAANHQPGMTNDDDQYLPGNLKRDDIAEDIRKWKQWWLIPLYTGIGITVIGGLFMLWSYQTSGIGIWFACSWFPFLIGLLLLMISFGSNKSPWLHVRIRQAPGNYPRTIAISFPLPLRFTTWLIQTFGNFIPGEKASQIADLIVSLGDSITPDQPFFVDVDEGDNGEKVQVFIG